MGADGQPITTLRDLLAGQDFADVTGQAAQKPASGGATDTSATCDYGGNMKLSIQIGGSVEAAVATYQTALKACGFTSVKPGAMAGLLLARANALGT